jgi:hypothetical protein
MGWFTFAIASVICFGVRGILYQWTAQRPIDRNLLLFGVYVSGMAISFTMNIFAKESWTHGSWLGILMGLFSFAANSSVHKGYAVGRATIIESLSIFQFVGLSIIILGLLIFRVGNDLQKGELHGWKWGGLSMIFFGLTDIASKQATLLEASILPVLTLMFGTGSLLFLCSYMRKFKFNSNILGGREAHVLSFENQTSNQIWSTKRILIWGLVVGITNISGMILMLAAFRDGITGIVSAICSMSAIVVLLYARFVLKEKMSSK